MKKNTKSLILSIVGLSLLAFSISSCKKNINDQSVNSSPVAETYSDSVFVATDWTTATHSKSGAANFGLVFDDSKVHRIDIVVTKNRWQLMLANMTTLYGAFGTGSQPGGGSTVTENPMFVPAEVFYNGKQWYKVGVRFKGNSSLESTWKSGNYKMSFKLDFDEFEDQYPQIDNQRFNGFKQLSLKNNFDDKSMLREKVAADIFRSEGLAVSNTAFYVVYVDYGDGPTYFGVYTLTEEVDDTVIKNQFADSKGNLYKPDGTAASFAAGTYNTTELVKETNEDAADFTDVRALYDAVNDATRTTDPAAWRTKLDNAFDTDVFLHYLATNTAIQNWDTYGKMTHNYFLYNVASTNKLTWIPWDNNEALQTGKQGGALSMDFAGLNVAQWPLIGYMYQDAVYKAKYKLYAKQVIEGSFKAATIQALYTKYAALVEPYAITEKRGYSFLTSAADFTPAINALKTHATNRETIVKDYVR